MQEYLFFGIKGDINEICGIDASSSCSGICLFEDKKLVDSTKVKSDKGNGFREASCQMIERVTPIILEYKGPIYIYGRCSYVY